MAYPALRSKVLSSTELHAKANIQTMQERILDLSKRYVDRASKYDNPLIKSLILALDSTAKGPLAVISSSTSFLSSLLTN